MALRFTWTVVADTWTDVYQRVEATPVVGGGLKLVQQNTTWITEPVKNKVMTIADPLIDRVDSNLKPMYDLVDEKVLVPARKDGALTVRSVANATISTLTSTARVTIHNR